MKINIFCGSVFYFFLSLQLFRIYGIYGIFYSQSLPNGTWFFKLTFLFITPQTFISHETSQHSMVCGNVLKRHLFSFELYKKIFWNQNFQFWGG